MRTGWKILVTARALFDTGAEAVAELEKAGCEVVASPHSAAVCGEALLQSIEGFDATIATMDRYNADIFASPRSSRLKIISRWGVGYDAIDIDAATRAGVVVTYTPGLLDETVADFTFALMLGWLRRIHEGDRLMRQGIWQREWGHNLHGKTLGLIGFGRIGQAVARRAVGFDLKLLACDPLPPKGPPPFSVEMVGLDELLRSSDLVSLHAAFAPENRHLIGEAQLRRMKPTAVLINTARGGFIDERALLKALEQKWIAGAALDVFEAEPLEADHPLRRLPNVLLAPHQAAFTRETGQRVSWTAARAVLDLMGGSEPRFVLNRPVLAAPNLRASQVNR